MATGVVGAAEMVIVTVAVNPALAAVITAEPTATPVTRPEAETVATVGAADVHVVGRTTMAPAESRNTAVSCVVMPTGMLDAVVVTASEASGVATTETVTLPTMLPVAAVMVHDPTPTPVIIPLEDTVATEGQGLFHTMGRPASALPAASFTVATA